MARSVEEWGERFKEKPVSTSFQFLLLLVAAGILVTVVIWGFNTGFSFWWGSGSAVQQKNSAQNFIAAQAQFHRDLATIEADKQKLLVAQGTVRDFQAAHPDYQGNDTPYDPLAQTYQQDLDAVTALRSSCQDAVSDYDQAARDYLTADWRDAGLPSSLDPATACDP